MPRPNTYIWESVSPGLVPAVQAMSRLLSSTTIAVSLLLLSFRLALTVLPFIWRHVAEPWCYYQYGNAIFLCAHDDVTSFPFFFKGCTCLGFAQVGNLSVTPTKLCPHCPPLVIPLPALGARWAGGDPCKGYEDLCGGVQPLSRGVRKDKQLHSQLLTWPTKSPSEKKLTAACGAKAASADVPLFQSRADDLPR